MHLAHIAVKVLSFRIVPLFSLNMIKLLFSPANTLKQFYLLFIAAFCHSSPASENCLVSYRTMCHCFGDVFWRTGHLINLLVSAICTALHTMFTKRQPVNNIQRDVFSVNTVQSIFLFISDLAKTADTFFVSVMHFFPSFLKPHSFFSVQNSSG